MDINIKYKTVKLLTFLIKHRRKFCMTLVGLAIFLKFLHKMPDIIHKEEGCKNKLRLSQFKAIILQKTLLTEWKIAAD